MRRTGGAIPQSCPLASACGRVQRYAAGQLDEAAERVREPHVLDRPQSTSSSGGAQTRYARHCARETATFSRFRDMRKSIPRGASLARGGHREEDDRRLLALELVDRADRDASGSRSCSSRTCALKGATTITSPGAERPRRRRPSPSRCRRAAARSRRGSAPPPPRTTSVALVRRPPASAGRCRRAALRARTPRPSASRPS